MECSKNGRNIMVCLPPAWLWPSACVWLHSPWRLRLLTLAMFFISAVKTSLANVGCVVYFSCELHLRQPSHQGHLLCGVWSGCEYPALPPVFASKHLHALIPTHVHTPIHTCSNTQLPIYTHVHAHIHVHMSAHACMHTHTHAHTHTHTHWLTHIHTHTHS